MYNIGGITASTTEEKNKNSNVDSDDDSDGTSDDDSDDNLPPSAVGKGDDEPDDMAETKKVDPSPNNIMKIAITHANTGRRMKNCDIIIGLPVLLGLSSC